MVERSLFAERLRAAVIDARDFARTLIVEDLPDAVVLRVEPNASYDGNPLHPAEKVFPGDSRIDLASLAACSEEQVVDLLWREGAVPEWINVTVVGVVPDATVIELLSCGRFTSDETLLYHEHEGRPPFHVLGPTLPVSWSEGQRFSIFHHAGYRRREDMGLLAAHAQEVWSLTLEGSAFDDEDVASLPASDSLEILDLDAMSLDGSGLGGLDRFPRLRVLRLRLRPGARFSLEAIPCLPGLQEFWVEGLVARPWGFDHLAERMPALEGLKIGAEDTLHASGACSPGLRRFSVDARCLSAIPRLPADLEGVGIHLARPGPGGLDALFAHVRGVRSLDLRGTPTTEPAVIAWIERFCPRHVDIVDTGIDEAGVRRIAAAHPGLRIHPRYR